MRSSSYLGMRWMGVSMWCWRLRLRQAGEAWKEKNPAQRCQRGRAQLSFLCVRVWAPLCVYTFNRFCFVRRERLNVWDERKKNLVAIMQKTVCFNFDLNCGTALVFSADPVSNGANQLFFPLLTVPFIFLSLASAFFFQTNLSPAF